MLSFHLCNSFAQRTQACSPKLLEHTMTNILILILYNYHNIYIYQPISQNMAKKSVIETKSSEPAPEAVAFEPARTNRSITCSLTWYRGELQNLKTRIWGEPWSLECDDMLYCQDILSPSTAYYCTLLLRGLNKHWSPSQTSSSHPTSPLAMKESPAEATHYSKPKPVWSTPEVSISFIHYLKSWIIHIFYYIFYHSSILYEPFILYFP